MRLAWKIGITVLLLAGLAASQEQTAPTPPLNPAIRRPRPQRVPRPQPHNDDPWYPDPPPEGGVANSNQQPVIAPAANGGPSAPGGAPAAQPAQQPIVRQAIDEQLPPPTPPQVAYQNGLLTVRAFNSTLESVLSAIRSKAGIQFEGLEGGASERVVISMGPSPEGEVLATLLGGSRFDYVAVDRADSPGIVQRVLLSPRRGSSAAGASPGTQPSAPAMSNSEDEENGDEGSADPAESPQDTPARPPTMQAQPQMQINPPPAQPQPNQQPTSPKTPEQLLEELKQMQQRQQEQQQQQQQPAPQKPPPLPQL